MKELTGDHKAQLLSDVIHAVVVGTVVVLTAVLLAIGVSIPQDTVASVFGGAIGYAAGRSGSIARSRPVRDDIP